MGTCSEFGGWLLHVFGSDAIRVDGVRVLGGGIDKHSLWVQSIHSWLLSLILECQWCTTWNFKNGFTHTVMTPRLNQW